MLDAIRQVHDGYGVGGLCDIRKDLTDGGVRCPKTAASGFDFTSLQERHPIGGRNPIIIQYRLGWTG